MQELQLKLDKEKKYGLAISGGRDSMALLNLFYEAKYNFFVINIEHGIRKIKSIRDTLFVEKYAKERNIEFKSHSVNALEYARENKMSIEAAAHKLRYEIFESYLNQHYCDYIVLGHHKNDQAETILMHLLRGANVRGLSGMREINGRYIRPLLKYTREDIDNYITENSIKYVEDETNQDEKYRRNKIRKYINKIAKVEPQFVKSIIKLGDFAQEMDDLIKSCLGEMVLKRHRVYVLIDRDDAIVKSDVRRACEYFIKNIELEEIHYNLVLKLKHQEEGKTLDFPNDIKIMRGKKEYIIYLSNYIEEYKGISEYERAVVIETKTFEKNGSYVDADKIPTSSVFRYRQKGDVFIKTNGHKVMLGDYLSDMKVDTEDRNNVLLLANGNEVLQILGYATSDNIKIDNNTKKIFKITEKGE